jgi:Fur family zinc uptake transcriptional regulator/Fur family ferric uptake transcriptional regulator
MEMKHQAALKGLHIKQTPKRLALLEILGGQATYLSPPEIWVRMKQRFKRIGLPTVYRNLEKLSENGIITRVLHPNRQLYYYYCSKGVHHHHFVCYSCGRIEDLDYCWAETLRNDVERRLKGRMAGHVLQVHGTCKGCLKSSRRPPHPAPLPRKGGRGRPTQPLVSSLGKDQRYWGRRKAEGEH